MLTNPPPHPQRVVVVGASVSGGDIAFDLATSEGDPLTAAAADDDPATPTAAAVYAVVVGRNANPYFGDLPFRHPNIRRVPTIVRVDVDPPSFSPSTSPATATVHFADGTSASGIDHLIFGTGYSFSVPFLPRSLAPAPTPARNRIPGLYQHVVCRSDPSLLFVGAVGAGLTFKIFEWQAVLAARLLAGTAGLPFTSPPSSSPSPPNSVPPREERNGGAGDSLASAAAAKITTTTTTKTTRAKPTTRSPSTTSRFLLAQLPPEPEMSAWESDRVASRGDGARFLTIHPDFEAYFEAVRRLAGPGAVQEHEDGNPSGKKKKKKGEEEKEEGEEGQENGKDEDGGRLLLPLPLPLLPPRQLPPFDPAWFERFMAGHERRKDMWARVIAQAEERTGRGRGEARRG